MKNLTTLTLCSILGKENLSNYKFFIPLLCVGLARHLIHYDSYDKLSDLTKPELGKLLQDYSPIQNTTLFTTPMITGLKEHVRIAMPCEKHYIFSSLQLAYLLILML